MSGTSFPLVMTSQGAQPTPPATLNALVIAQAQSLAPGLTANLPGALIEDVSSTATGALVEIDQERVDLINSLTPFGANAFLLVLLGQIYLGQGSTAAASTNTSVYVQFTGTVGFVIAPGFVVSDGTNQYTVAAPGGVVATGGVSPLIFTQATNTGSWAVPANTVTTIITSLPSGVTLSVTNPSAGTPGEAAQTEESFRAQVLTAGLVASTGMSNYLKTLLAKVSGVVPNLVAVRTPAANQWEVIVGGTGDPYEIATAIFEAVQDISTLVGSTLKVTNITASNPGTVTTNLNHGYAIGQVGTLSAVNPGTYDGAFTVGTIVSPNQFTIGNTTGFAAYVNNGTVTPNFRNTSVAINSFPDTYTIPFVLPPAQTVTVTVTWNTSSVSYVSPTTVAQLVQPAIAAYINALGVGQPINVLELNDAFVAAVANILPEQLITVLVFAVTIDGVSTSPGAGTQIIVGDVESSFACAVSSVTVIQG
jgi:hypothetical protein